MEKVVLSLFYKLLKWKPDYSKILHLNLTGHFEKEMIYSHILY